MTDREDSARAADTAIESPQPPSGPAERLCRWLRHPGLTRIAFLGSILLTVPALLGPLTLDDYVLGLLHRGGGGVHGFEGRDRNALFTFTNGTAASNEALIEEGVLLPWWTDRHHLNAFFRPLSSLTHRLDFWLFPEAPLAMHLHSLLWFLLLLAAVGGVYQSVQGASRRDTGAGRLAALALLLFAWDDAHGATLGWIANRNALIAGALSLPAIISHRRLVVRGPSMARTHAAGALLMGPACLALGLCAGEAAIGTLGYLAAHALHLERDPWWRRLLRLSPYGLVLAAWRVVYHLQGLGSGGSGAYHDPVREPFAFVGALAQNLPVLLGAQFGPPYADAAFWGPPEDRPLLLLLSALILGLVAVLSWPVWSRRAEARFYATGCVLSAVPVSASLPGERLLLLLGVGASGLVALLLSHYLASATRGARAAAALLVGIHLIAAPLALPALAYSMSLVGHRLQQAERELPAGPEVTEQVFILVNAPFDVMASYLQPMRAYMGRPRPMKLHWLATASSPLTLRRVNARTLEVHIRDGLLASPQARHYRRDLASLSAGARLSLETMDIEVVAADPKTGPTRVRFSFRVPLESDPLRFFTWRDGGFAPLSLPAPPRDGGVGGEPLAFPTEDFFRIVMPLPMPASR